MSHYKKFSEHRHGRDIAKQRIKGYDDGGSVRRFPVSGVQADLTRLRSAQGIDSGRIGGISGRQSNVVYGPGLNSRGDTKLNVLRRMRPDDMPHANGGRVDGDKAQDKAMIKKAMREHDVQLHGGKHTKLALKSGGPVHMTAGAESGVGRLQKTKMLARKH